MGFSGILVMSLSAILNFLTPVTVAVNNGCEFTKYLTMGQRDYIFNDQYPASYRAGTDCLWWIRSQPGTRIVITCSDINIPSSINCFGDKLKISLSGDGTYFRDSRNYCGTGSVSLVSNGSAIAVELVSTIFSNGGRFFCTLTPIQGPEPEPPTPKPVPSVCDCGWKRGTKIVGGVPTLVNEYPAMAGLIDASIKEVVCGATIISNRYVISAAHCMRNIALGNMGVLVGDWNISTGLDTAAAALYSAETYWEHPDFDANAQLNDLAIVRTQRPIVFSLFVGPICLPFLYSHDTFQNDNVTILGWGQEFFNGPQSNVLEKVTLEVISNSDCQSRLTGNNITSGQLCTFAHGKDACQHDSGGPVLWEDPETLRLQLVGVISYGLGCATTRPGVSTRVTNYLSWIVTVTKDTNYCIN